MAALAIPLLEAAAKALLVALGVTATVGGAVVVSDEVRKRTQAANDAKARTEAQPITTTRQPCEKCPPDCGVLAPRNVAGWSEDSIAYQRRIGGMPPAPPGFINEWLHNGVSFDGFESAQCLLKEAKARYDQFFDEWGGFKYSFEETIFAKMVTEAVSQNTAATPKPPTRLQWNFMEPISYRHMSRILSRAAPEIEVLYRP